jgi:hypothetical protein
MNLKEYSILIGFWIICSPLLLGFAAIWIISLFPKDYWKQVLTLQFCEGQ